MNSLDDAAPGIPKHGWQQKAAQKADDFFMSTSVWPRLPESSQALLRSQGRTPCLVCLLLAAPLRSTSNTSVSCSFAVFGFPVTPLLAPAGVTVLSTLATTEQLARMWGCWVAEGPGECRGSCVSLVAVSLSTLQFATSILECLTWPMRVVWRSWLTRMKMEQLWKLLAAARKRAILNWLAITGPVGGPRHRSWWSECQLICLLRPRYAVSRKSCCPEPNKRVSPRAATPLTNSTSWRKKNGPQQHFPITQLRGSWFLFFSFLLSLVVVRFFFSLEK